MSNGTFLNILLELENAIIRINIINIIKIEIYFGLYLFRLYFFHFFDQIFMQKKVIVLHLLFLIRSFIIFPTLFVEIITQLVVSNWNIAIRVNWRCHWRLLVTISNTFWGFWSLRFFIALFFWSIEHSFIYDFIKFTIYRRLYIIYFAFFFIIIFVFFKE